MLVLEAAGCFVLSCIHFQGAGQGCKEKDFDSSIAEMLWMDNLAQSPKTFS